ncbi:MFS general substrate transporter [Armillaria novae-zelandiae]|uniref:MFS general substrate transporter n=1 Tax=Armillaria novae-zelandiae TaxID=153914 RepID=A0AA39PBI6_9AGAR|nr:MFS general substrate transporter [Armillaria novae-zelandiae]
MKLLIKASRSIIPQCLAAKRTTPLLAETLGLTDYIFYQNILPNALGDLLSSANLQFAAICWCFFLEGWNDGTTGPLIPVMQESYHINFVVVSLLFVFNCIGFILGAGTNVYLNERYGLGKIMFIGSLFQVAAYAMESPQPPFPVMVIAYALAGFGMSLQNAQGNGFVGGLKEHKTTKLNMLHAAYGLGAFVSPLVATHFSYEHHWSYYFIISTGIAVSNSVVLAFVFRFKTQEGEMPQKCHGLGFESETNCISRSRSANLYRSILNTKAVHFLAVFAFIYIGTEVTLGGWIVTFIINERQGGKSAGYFSSGFFGGLTLGRLCLIWFSKKVGEHRVIFVYALLAIALEITVWFVPSIIENGVAISFVGLLLGPMFPILVGHAARILPAWLLTESVGWIAATGMSGSAALPFITGLLASRYGIRSLQPLVVSMMCTLAGVWALVPRTRRVD